MRAIRLRRLIIALLAISVMVGYQQVKQADGLTAQAASTIPSEVPTPSPVGILGIYLTTGFSLQPTYSYTYVQNSRILTTATVHSIFDLNPLASDHFQWAQTTDKGENWSDIRGAKDADLKVTPNHIGTVYYQQRFQHFAFSAILAPTYYSEVAALTTVQSPIPATGIKVSTDNDYLYNNQASAQQTYVHATPDPLNATGDLTWSSSDNSLATVSEQTGEVTANISGETGTVSIRGTMTNADGKVVSAEVPITIGGGLDAQTVNEGEPATFNVRGKFDQTPEKVAWYRVDANGKETMVNDQTGTTYTTPPTSSSDQRTQYYARITIRTDGKEQTINTNKASLIVKPNLPRVKIDNTVEYVPTAGDLTPQVDHLDNVVPGDVCRITGTITDENKESRLNNGDFTVKLPKDVTVNSLKVDGHAAGYNRVPEETDVLYLVSDQSFKERKTHIVSVTFKTQHTQNALYSTGFKLLGYTDENRGQFLETFTGKDVVLNLTDGQLDATAHDVNFGNVTAADVGRDLPGQVANNGDLLEVTDNRREKSATTIDLRQESPFKNGQVELDSTIRFVPGPGGTPQELSKNDQPVLTTKDGTAVPSISALRGQKLTIRVNKGASRSGKYQTKLIWTIVTGP